MDNQGQPARRSRLAPEPDFLAEDMAETPAVAAKVTPTDAMPSEGKEPPTMPAAAPTERRSAARVVVTDIHMSFLSMVIFMVKLAFAMIPAAIIITFIVLAMIAVAARVTGVT